MTSTFENISVQGVSAQGQPATLPNHLVRLRELQTLLADVVSTPGAAGANGQSVYPYVAFASDADGTDFSLTPGSGLNYIAFKFTNSVIASPSAGDFTGLWKKYVGTDGAAGTDGADGETPRFAFASDASGTGFSLTPGSGLSYIAFKLSATALTDASDFAGLWKKYVGTDGAAGAAGADGQTTYFGFASDASGTGFSLTPGSGLNYIAFKSSATALTVAGDFAGLWKKYIGTDGAAGAAGAAGQTPYFAFASDASGTGFSLTPGSGLNYLAFKLSATALTLASDFAGLWKKYIGTDGSTGATGSTGAAGQSAYVYLGYASDASGTGFSLTPSDSLQYIAIKTSTTVISSPVVGDFAGLWKRYGATAITVDGASALTLTSGVVGLHAASANTANYVVQRDGSGNFSAGQITAATLVIGGSATVSFASGAVTINQPLTTTALKVGSLAGVLKASAGIVAGSATSDDLTEGSTNLYLTAARVRGVALTGLTSTNVLLATDTIIEAFAKVDDFLGGDFPAGTIAGNLGITGNLAVTGTTTLGTLSGVLRATGGVVSGSSTTDHLTEGTNLYFTNTRADARITAARGANSGVAPLDSSGKVPLANLYAYGATPYGAANQSAMLALSAAKQGDFCLRSDSNLTYVLQNNTPATLGNWIQILYPVMSVNGLTGTVVLGTDVVAEGSTNLYFTNTRADARITAARGAASGICPLDSNSLVPASNLPPVGNSTWTVNSQATQTALTSALKGDIALRTDNNLTYVLSNNTPTSFASWVPLLYPVNSVNGSTGTVVLTTSNVAEGSNLYFTNARGIAATLTGYASGAGTVASTDTILQAIQKLNGNIAAIASLPLAGGTMTGSLQFSGSTNNGLRVNNLTAAQITALTGANGNIVYQSDGTKAIRAYVDGGWITLGANNQLPLTAGSGFPLTGELFFKNSSNVFSIAPSSGDTQLNILNSGGVAFSVDTSNNCTVAGTLKATAFHIGAHQVVGAQATLSLSGGSTAATGWADSTAQSDFNNLVSALRTHGLFA